MKKSSSIIAYVAALVIGIILLSLHETNERLMISIVRAMGILITVPSALMLISSFIGKKTADAVKIYPAWYSVLVAVAGLVLGIWMLCMPEFFMGAMVITLGVILILTGAAQFVFIYMAARPYGANPLWYIVPVLVIAGGFIICFIDPHQVYSGVTLATGILLVVYAANGLASFGREYKLQKRIEAETAELAKRNQEF